MNILVEQLPTAVLIDGREVEINSDFRAAMRVILAFEDPELAEIEKQAVMLDLLYPTPPDNLLEAFAAGMRFLNGGKVSTEESEPAPRLYSFSKDADLIFAAFRQTHGIDLETAQLHWWKFLALFMDLGSETTFCNLISLRKRLKSGKASKEDRAAAREMAELVNLPELDTRSLEEKEREAEFMRLLDQSQKKEQE